MEWKYRNENDDEDNMEVDIGYIPLLQVQQLQPSSPVFLQDGDNIRIDRRC